MLRKVWEFLLLGLLLMVAVNIVVAAVKPFLPVIGLTVIGLGAFFGVRLILSRKRFW